MNDAGRQKIPDGDVMQLAKRKKEHCEAHTVRDLWGRGAACVVPLSAFVRLLIINTFPQESLSFVFLKFLKPFNRD